MFIIKPFILTCFGHHYAYHQENRGVHCRIWCSALVVMVLAVLNFSSTQPHPSQPMQNTICGSAHSCSPDDGHTACVPAPHNHSHHNQCRTPYAAVRSLVLLMMAIMMPETCWDKSLIINIRLVASCWFLSLHPAWSIVGFFILFAPCYVNPSPANVENMVSS